jgi:hypothetical protein
VSSEYNKGEPEDRRRALSGAVDYTKLLTTLATGTIVLTATFLGEFYAGHMLSLLIASWAALGLSVLAGLVAFGEYISQLAESKLQVRRGLMEGANLLQWFLLVAGVALFAIFAVSNVTSSPPVGVDRYGSGIEHRHPTAVVICPADAVGGCSGYVEFRVQARADGKGLELGTVPFATDGPGDVMVTSPRALSCKAMRSSSDRLRIVVRGGGRYGGAKTVAATIRTRSRCGSRPGPPSARSHG